MDTIVELGLDPDDRFFDHVEQSALASALSSRTRRNSLNSASVLPAPNHLPGHAIVLSHAARTHPAEETNAGIFELRPKLLCERFNILFAMCGFQTFLAVLSVAVSISLTIGEPSGTSSAIVFWIVYVAVTWCIFSRVEYSLLLGEVLSRYQAIYVLVWGVVLAVASAYQAAFEYEAGGLYASESLYNMHIICSMVFNSTAFVVVVLLDAMPSLTHVTKAGALLLFLANASRIWITDRILLSYPLRPQLLCAVSPLFSESCFNTQRLKVAALSSVSVFLIFNFYVSMRNALLPADMHPTFGVIMSKLTLQLIEPEDVVQAIPPATVVDVVESLPNPTVLDVTQHSSTAITSEETVVRSVNVKEEPVASGANVSMPTVSDHKSVLPITNNVPQCENAVQLTQSSVTQVALHATAAVSNALLNNEEVPEVAESGCNCACSLPEPEPEGSVIIRTAFLSDFPASQRKLSPLLGYWLYSQWQSSWAKFFYLVLGCVCMFLFVTGQPTSMTTVPIHTVLMLALILWSASAVDVNILLDLMLQFEFCFLAASIILYTVLSQFSKDLDILALFKGSEYTLEKLAENINVITWMLCSFLLIAADAYFAPIAVKRSIVTLWLANNCFVLYRNLFVFPKQMVLIDGVQHSWINSAQLCLAGECVTAQSVRLQALTTLVIFSAKYLVSLVFRPRSLMILKTRVTFENNN